MKMRRPTPGLALLSTVAVLTGIFHHRSRATDNRDLRHGRSPSKSSTQAFVFTDLNSR